MTTTINSHMCNEEKDKLKTVRDVFLIVAAGCFIIDNLVLLTTWLLCI